MLQVSPPISGIVTSQDPARAMMLGTTNCKPASPGKILADGADLCLLKRLNPIAYPLMKVLSR
jgi:hypothetical protein